MNVYEKNFEKQLETIEDLAKYKEALEQIASGGTPCTECNKPHERRVVEGKSGSYFHYEDPEDGHYYRRMSPIETAELVLGIKKNG